MRNVLRSGASFFAPLFFWAFCQFASYASPRGAQELIESGHWVYDAFKEVSLECGLVNFADSTPISIQQLKLYMSEIDEEKLSESGKRQLERINSYIAESNLSFGYDILSVGIEPSVSLEGFYKSEDDLDWVWDRYERKPMLGVPFKITVGDYVTMSMDTILSQNKGASLHDGNYTNILYNPDDFDINFPDTAYLSTGMMLSEKTGFAFQLGKGSRNIGDTMMGSVIWSDYLTGVSYGQLEFYCPVFKYTGTVSQFNVDKYVYAHQIDARFFKKFQLTVFEGLLVYAPLELRYLNPWTILHGWAAWRDYEPKEDDPESHTCDYMGVKAQFAPVDNLRVYGLFAMTQFQTAYERSNYPDTPTPNGLGAQLGTEYYVPYKGGRFRFGIEGYWADPYLYIKESPNWSMVRTYSENMGDKAIFYEWIGSPFGPDTISGELQAGYEVPGKWSVNFTYLFMARGEQSGTNVFKYYDENGDVRWGGQKTEFNMEDDEESGKKADTPWWAYPDKDSQEDWESNRDKSSPSGTVEYVNRFAVRGVYHANDWLKFTLQPAFVFTFNNGNVSGESRQGMEIAFAVDIDLCKLKK
ncbi:MAG: hypothetical protein IJ717_09780 [Treponema sp.]|nr:hypothetical protein [Treponema sp.]